MRWHTVDDAGALFGVDELVGPERGTGRMSDLEFLHVTAKRILNHVPSMSRLNFAWTINVYRGCSHGCTYCLAGDTPVLLADGTERAIAELRIGDAISESSARNPGRRLRNLVLDHWQTGTRRAYRVHFGDGAHITASAEHRFMTTRGWIEVANLAGDDRLV
ncbi:MAG TPA: hypothetical protein VKQ07_04435, partial [Jatrophihabitantaceae bacterium]|nr:hypothetical protein [Jatrophihabitantaceae bacterium]